MKNLLVLILLSVFSFPTFGQEEVVAEQSGEKGPEKVKASDEKKETKDSEIKEGSEKSNSEEKKVSDSSGGKQVSEEAKSSKEEPVSEEAKPSKEEPVSKEAKPSKEERVPKEAKPSKEEQVSGETKPSEEKQKEQQDFEEKPAAINRESDKTDSTVSVQIGMSYECGGGRSYTLHEPGVTSESHLCELDAGHTENPADWYALNESSFCREKLQEIITQYNCVIKK